MSDKQSEMSLDDVLQSIKQMVTDKEPPVLDLTDMMSPDGSIVKLKKGFDPGGSTPEAAANSTNNSIDDKGDFSAFLNLAQANAEMATQSARSSNRAQHTGSNAFTEMSPVSEKKFQPLEKTIREIATSIIKEWLTLNLERVMRETIREEVHKAMKE